ncbi:hypothetical protein DFH08DRAFT_240904 [Mycena albidolilacea]|uniref:Uncharacterized protein n=1 Tax=Mycena albidolilacea TaxID=1033008 RepID=A0AAD6ZVP8_9AGAR|nr:hypothetical protein DFH08DRAFT_240904 [Mycena albidolilacea]
MFNSKALLTAFAAVLASIAAATPVGPVTEVPVTVTVCTGGVGVGCAAIPIVSETCVNLTGGLSFLNKQISTAIIPAGFVCQFFQRFNCNASPVKGSTDSEIVLTAGTWNFFNVPGLSGRSTNFNDLTSSFTCSPI